MFKGKIFHCVFRINLIAQEMFVFQDVVVLYYSPWCGACQVFRPTFLQLELLVRTLYPHVSFARYGFVFSSPFLLITLFHQFQFGSS